MRERARVPEPAMKLQATMLLAALVLNAGPTVAQSTTVDFLKGKSIVIDYRERVTGPSFGSYRVRWHDRVYVSTEGRIFHRADTRSENPRATGQRELIGGQQSNTLMWDGHAFVRSFINPKSGVRIRQAIAASRSGDRIGCSMSLERSGAPPGVEYVAEHNGCQVIEGNVFAGSR